MTAGKRSARYNVRVMEAANVLKTFVVRVAPTGAGRIRGTVEQVRTGRKEPVQTAEDISRVIATIQQDVFHSLAQFRFNLFVNGELTGVHDGHVESSANCVKQKRSVHRLADSIVAAEGK